MRLIDADELKENYTQIFVEAYGIKCAEMFQGVINQTPTAYNVEQVVEELEENKKKSLLFQHEAELQGSIVNDNYFGGKRNAYADVIEIVRNGGVVNE